MNPLSFLAPYKLGIEVLAGFALLAAISFGAHEFLEHERDIGRNEVRAEYAQKLQEAKDAAAKREADLRAQRDDAVAQGATREIFIRNLAISSGASSVSMRDTLTAIRNGVPSATVEALRNSTSTLTTVLADCQARYRSVAEAADRHASDARTLSDAWPENKVEQAK